MMINTHNRQRDKTKYYVKFFLILTAKFILGQWQSFLLLHLCLQGQTVQGGHDDPLKQWEFHTQWQSITSQRNWIYSPRNATT